VAPTARSPGLIFSLHVHAAWFAAFALAALVEGILGVAALAPIIAGTSVVYALATG
jgi:hypothetical protein